MEPLVSVIIPVYNVLSYLREALDSVINQTYRNLEILIVDDGSTDGSGDVCDEYLSDPRVVVIHQENKGLSGARNTGLDRMNGDYVAFLDSDDAFKSNMIEYMVKEILQTGADTVMCGYDECISDKKMYELEDKEKKPFHLQQRKMISASEALNALVSNTRGWTIVWNKLYSRTLWNNLRFPYNRLFEDVHVTYRIFEKCHSILLLPEQLMYYRKRKGSITKTLSIKHLQDFLLGTKLVEEYISKHIPNIFSYESARFHREYNACALSIKYANLLKANVNKHSLSSLRKEIVLQWSPLKHCKIGFESRIVRLLFLHAPSLILPAGTCWRLSKRILRKLFLH